MASNPPAHAHWRGRLTTIRDALLTGLVERDVPVRLALLAALSGEHLLLLGVPGTAKSLIARRLRLAFADATLFERLLTRFTVPEELFGPLSIKGLEQDRYERLTDRYLPTASIAFLDEIFKANSAILNALLTLLNEREFDNGVSRQKTPLVAVIGASNELPEGPELGALYDRFLLRVSVAPVSADGFRDLLRLRGHAEPVIPDDARLTPDDLTAIRAAASSVEVPEDVEALLVDLREWCLAEGIAVSDRRWRKIVHLLQVSALTNGRDRVSIWDAWLLQHATWSSPEEREKVYAWYAERVGSSSSMDPSRLTRVVAAWEGRLKQDKESRSQARDAKGRLLYRSEKGGRTIQAKGPVQKARDGEPLFLAPTGLQVARSGYYGHHTVQDRTNDGRGYTRAELDAGRVHDRRQGTVAFGSWKGRDAYLAEPSSWLTEVDDLPPVMEPTRHPVAYVKDCLKQLDRVGADVLRYRDKLQAHMATLENDIRDHLWVTPDFAEPASASLRGTWEEVERLWGRLSMVRKGFTMLPQRPDDAGSGGAGKRSKGGRRKRSELDWKADLAEASGHLGFYTSTDDP